MNLELERFAASITKRLNENQDALILVCGDGKREGMSYAALLLKREGAFK